MSFLFEGGEKAFDSGGPRFSFLDSDGVGKGENLESKFDLTFDSDSLTTTVNGDVLLGDTFGVSIAYTNGLFFVSASSADTENYTELGKIFTFEPNGRQLSSVPIGEGGLATSLTNEDHIGDRASLAAGQGYVAFGIDNIAANDPTGRYEKVFAGPLHHIDDARYINISNSTEFKARADHVLGPAVLNFSSNNYVMTPQYVDTYSNRSDATLLAASRENELGRRLAIDRKRLAILELGDTNGEGNVDNNLVFGRIWIVNNMLPSKNTTYITPEIIDTGTLEGYVTELARNSNSYNIPAFAMGDGVVVLISYWYQFTFPRTYDAYIHIFCVYTGEKLVRKRFSYGSVIYPTVRSVIIHHGKIYIGGYFHDNLTSAIAPDPGPYYTLIRLDINGNIEKQVESTDQGLPGDMCIGGDRLWVACDGTDEVLLEYDLDLNLISRSSVNFPDDRRPVGPGQMAAGSGVIMQAASVNNSDSANANTLLYKYDETYGDYIDDVLQGF